MFGIHFPLLIGAKLVYTELLSMVYLIFLMGLVGLWQGSEFVTKGGIGIARRLGLSETFIGITFLAIGTDLPEVIVSVTGALEQLSGVDTSGLVIGNILGSTLAQITLVLGIAGLMKVLEIDKSEIISNGSAMIAAALAFWLFSQDGTLSQVDGILLLIGYVVYIFLLSNNERKIAKAAKKHQPKKKKLLKRRQKKPIWLFLLYLLAGLVVVGVSSHFVIEKGLEIAELLHISQTLVGIIMIGVGTSLPELAVSISALSKGSAGLSVGNLIGSNIVDILLALGLSATIGGWSVSRSVVAFDLPFLVVSSIVIILFLLTRTKFERKEALLTLALYYGFVLLKLQGF